MDIRLIVATGSKAGHVIKVKLPKFSIGRSSQCHLQIGGSSVEPHHCTLVNREGYVGVRDNHTPGGTYVNDEQVDGERELKNGDKLRVGSTMTFEIQLTVGISGDKKPKVTSVSEAAARASQKKKEAAATTSGEDLDLFAIFGETAPTEEELPFVRKKKIEETQKAEAGSEDALSKEKRQQEVTRSAADDTIRAILNQKKP